VFDGTDSCVTAVVPLLSDDFRPMANLSHTPGLPINDLDGRVLLPGDKGEEVLQEWVGWRLNREYFVRSDGVVMLKVPAKL
jgi:alpha-methylacyl-CoA racemase